jgi:hypothetical protein
MLLLVLVWNMRWELISLRAPSSFLTSKRPGNEIGFNSKSNFMDLLTDSKPSQPVEFRKGRARYVPKSPFTAARAFAKRCWALLNMALCMSVALPIAALLVLIFGLRCVTCNGYLWPWQKRADVRYTDNIDAIHEGCCAQLARDIN